MVVKGNLKRRCGHLNGTFISSLAHAAPWTTSLLFMSTRASSLEASIPTPPTGKQLSRRLSESMFQVQHHLLLESIRGLDVSNMMTLFDRLYGSSSRDCAHFQGGHTPSLGLFNGIAEVLVQDKRYEEAISWLAKAHRTHGRVLNMHSFIVLVQAYHGIRKQDKIEALWRRVTASLHEGDSLGGSTYTHLCNAVMTSVAVGGKVALVEEIWQEMLRISQEQDRQKAEGMLTCSLIDARPDINTVAARFKAHVSAGKPVANTLALLQDMRDLPQLHSDPGIHDDFYTDLLLREMSLGGHVGIVKRVYEHRKAKGQGFTGKGYCLLLHAFRRDDDMIKSLVLDLTRDMGNIMASHEPFRQNHFARILRSICDERDHVDRHIVLSVWQIMTQYDVLPGTAVWLVILEHDRRCEEKGTLLPFILDRCYGVLEGEPNTRHRTGTVDNARCQDFPYLIQACLKANPSILPSSPSSPNISMQAFQWFLQHHCYVHGGAEPCLDLTHGLALLTDAYGKLEDGDLAYRNLAHLCHALHDVTATALRNTDTWGWMLCHLLSSFLQPRFAAPHPRHAQCRRMVDFLRSQYEPSWQRWPQELGTGLRYGKTRVTSTGICMGSKSMLQLQQHYDAVLLRGYLSWRDYDAMDAVWRRVVVRRAPISAYMYHMMICRWVHHGDADRAIQLFIAWSQAATATTFSASASTASSPGCGLVARPPLPPLPGLAEDAGLTALDLRLLHHPTGICPPPVIAPAPLPHLYLRLWPVNVSHHVARDRLVKFLQDLSEGHLPIPTHAT